MVERNLGWLRVAKLGRDRGRARDRVLKDSIIVLWK